VPLAGAATAAVGLTMVLWFRRNRSANANTATANA